jgi:hypothetical protein
MERKKIEVGGYAVTQLSETEYEAENKEQNLDFHFDTAHPSAVEVFAFDSLLPINGEKDPCIAAFYAEDLEGALRQAMALTRRSLEGSSKYHNVVLRLRDVSNRLTSTPEAENKMVLFPGWHEGYEDDNEPLIKEAAAAILAKKVEPDEGTYVSQRAVAALIHYIADMME